MCNMRLCYEAGFNAVNIPDSPALLETMNHSDFPGLDILQGEHLSYVNVKATRAQVKNADYMRLTDGTDTFYYIVEDFTMTSTYVAMLSIVMDYFTTHGGVAGITFLDGVVERHHVAVEDDKYGAYTGKVGKDLYDVTNSISYVELQFHGGVSVNNIEKVYIHTYVDAWNGRQYFNIDTKQIDKLEKALKKAGIDYEVVK